MIIDSLGNSETYYGLGEGIKKAFEYLKNTDLASLKAGKHEIEGDKLFVLIQEYETRPVENGKWESHKRYLDIQYIISGRELMGYAKIWELTDTVDLTPEKDVLNYKDGNSKGSFVKMNAGDFALFFPQDGHMPNITLESPCNNKKAVIKVKIDGIRKATCRRL